MVFVWFIIYSSRHIIRYSDMVRSPFHCNKLSPLEPFELYVKRLGEVGKDIWRLRSAACPISRQLRTARFRRMSPSNDKRLVVHHHQSRLQRGLDSLCPSKKYYRESDARRKCLTNVCLIIFHADILMSKVLQYAQRTHMSSTTFVASLINEGRGRIAWGAIGDRTEGRKKGRPERTTVAVQAKVGP